MDIAFTIAVWTLLVVLCVHGLRLTQRAHSSGRAEVPLPTPPPLLPEHPVFSNAAPPRELVGTGS